MHGTIFGTPTAKYNWIAASSDQKLTFEAGLSPTTTTHFKNNMLGFAAYSILDMHLLGKEGIETAPLYSVNDMREHRMVIEYEENKCVFKNEPSTWYKLPTARKGLLMITLTKEACARHRIEPEKINGTTSHKKKRKLPNPPSDL